MTHTFTPSGNGDSRGSDDTSESARHHITVGVAADRFLARKFDRMNRSGVASASDLACALKDWHIRGEGRAEGIES